jgi:hypothetical protein
MSLPRTEPAWTRKGGRDVIKNRLDLSDREPSPDADIRGVNESGVPEPPDPAAHGSLAHSNLPEDVDLSREENPTARAEVRIRRRRLPRDHD